MLILFPRQNLPKFDRRNEPIQNLHWQFRACPSAQSCLCVGPQNLHDFDEQICRHGTNEKPKHQNWRFFRKWNNLFHLDHRRVCENHERRETSFGPGKKCPRSLELQGTAEFSSSWWCGLAPTWLRHSGQGSGRMWRFWFSQLFYILLFHSF